MTVTVEPLETRIGIVWTVARRLHGHVDIEQCPEWVTTEHGAVHYAAKRWGVSEADVTVRPVQVVDV